MLVRTLRHVAVAATALFIASGAAKADPFLNSLLLAPVEAPQVSEMQTEGPSAEEMHAAEFEDLYFNSEGYYEPEAFADALWLDEIWPSDEAGIETADTRPSASFDAPFEAAFESLDPADIAANSLRAAADYWEEQGWEASAPPSSIAERRQRFEDDAGPRFTFTRFNVD